MRRRRAETVRHRWHRAYWRLRPLSTTPRFMYVQIRSGIRLADIIVFTYIYSPWAECFIRQQVMSVTHPPKLDRKSAGARIYT